MALELFSLTLFKADTRTHIRPGVDREYLATLSRVIPEASDAQNQKVIAGAALLLE